MPRPSESAVIPENLGVEVGVARAKEGLAKPKDFLTHLTKQFPHAGFTARNLNGILHGSQTKADRSRVEALVRFAASDQEELSPTRRSGRRSEGSAPRVSRDFDSNVLAGAGATPQADAKRELFGVLSRRIERCDGDPTDNERRLCELLLELANEIDHGA